MKTCSFVGGLCLALSSAVFAQVTLTNDSIEKMARARLGDDVIVSLIQNQNGNFDLSPDTLINLKRRGISSRVLAAMAGKGSPKTPPTASVAVAPAPAVVVDPYEDLDSGVYRKLRDNWVQVQTEQVNWKTGGVVKTVVTAGVIKGDVNGRLNGAASATQMNTPLQFLIKAQDGVQGTDFLLVHLHEKPDAREFRTVTGGVFHASGGALRDEIAFEQTRIAKRTYKLKLPGNLPPGEYAFLSPGLTGSSAAGSTGRAYTFRVVE
ncbi:MAG TPA: hypothetical protein VGM27_33425 [Acidobacteriaceae bacterium]